MHNELKQEFYGSQVLQATPSLAPGARQETALKRNISTLALIGLGIESSYRPRALSGAKLIPLAHTVLNGWMSIGSTVAIGLAQGGTVTVLYGFIWMTIINVFLAATLAEMASAMPSAGGQVRHVSPLPRLVC